MEGEFTAFLITIFYFKLWLVQCLKFVILLSKSVQFNYGEGKEQGEGTGGDWTSLKK